MAGSGAVNRNLALWQANIHSQLGTAMQMAIQRGANYGKSHAKWGRSGTGSARGGIMGSTVISPAQIHSSVYHTVTQGWYLENPNNNVCAYGDVTRPFGSKYRVLEQSRDSVIPGLMRDIASILRGTGYGLR